MRNGFHQSTARPLLLSSLVALYWKGRMQEVLAYRFFGRQAARVRVPGRSPFRIHETDKSKVVRQTNTFIIKVIKGHKQ